MVSAQDRAIARIGGASLVIGSLGFVAVFSYLASTFGYPDVLDHPAEDVLPALSAGGSPLRTAWLIYAAIPLSLLVGGLASASLLERGGGRMLARFGVVFAVVSAIAMIIGLARWPSIQWALAERWEVATGEQRAVYAAMFDAANTYLGNIFGEYIGEMMLAGWFATIGLALRSTGRRWLGLGSIVMSAVLAISAQRQLTHLVDPIADLNNVLLPVWLVVVGVIMWRAPRSSADRQVAWARDRNWLGAAPNQR
ncbi:MAG: DUF4386 family protein [Kofleriaceae bacterium]